MKIILFFILLVCGSTLALTDMQNSNKTENKELTDIVEDILRNAEVSYNPKISGLAMSQLPDVDSISNYLRFYITSNKFRKDTLIPFKTKRVVLYSSLDSITYLKQYAEFKKGISKYFELESDEIPNFLKLKISRNSKASLSILEKRQFGIGRSIIPNRVSDHRYLMLSDEYCSLVFIINYCINQVYAPADLRTIFLYDLENSELSVEEYLDLKYSKFMHIYNQYYAANLTEFYIQVCKEFGLLLDPYNIQKTTFTIKEPYKSMKDSDLIKIQEYFNKR